MLMVISCSSTLVVASPFNTTAKVIRLSSSNHMILNINLYDKKFGHMSGQCVYWPVYPVDTARGKSK